jgi:hypothetical protein
MSPKFLNPTVAAADVYARFVQRKLEFFKSNQPLFYEGGPLEVISKTYLASALEETYFLGDRSLTKLSDLGPFAGVAQFHTKEDLLHGAKALIASSLTMLGTHDYLPLDQKKYFPNDYKFRQVMLSFALGEAEQAKSGLRALVLANKNFDLTTPEVDHIYVYKVFHTPFQITLHAQAGVADAAVEIGDADAVKRFYNPAQLALYVCSRLADADPINVGRLPIAISKLRLNDYYVIADSTNEKEAADRLQGELNAALSRSGGSLRSSLEQKSLTFEQSEISNAFATGAKACAIDDEVKSRVFGQFSAVARVQVGNFGKYKFHVVFGGHLNIGQAQAVAEFLNNPPLATGGSRQSLPVLKEPAYVARMRLNG